MGKKTVTLESLIVLQVGPGKTSGLWMTTELWMIKVQIFRMRRLEIYFCVVFFLLVFQGSNPNV